MQPVPDWGTLPRMLRPQADASPDAIIVVDGETTLTVAELHSQAQETARALVGLGVAAGDRVAIWAPNTWQWVVTAFGAWDAGAIVVPLSTRAKGFEAGQILERTAAKVLFATTRFLGADYVKLLDVEFGPGGAAGPFRDLPDLRHLVVLDDDYSRPATLTASTLSEVAQTVSPDAAEDRALSVRPDDVFEILATSGTTGEPKGVMLTGQQVMRAYWDWSEIVGLYPGDRYPIVSPFAHGFGINSGMIACVMRTAQMHPIALFNPDSALNLVEDNRLSLLAGPPALFERLLSRPDLGDHDISSLRVAVVGAAAVPTELIRRMKAELGFERVVNAYGLIEGSFVTGTRAEDPIEVVANSAGRPAPDMEVRIVDDDGATLPPGERGEIWVRGYGVMVGYWQAPELTEQAIDADGWLHTGDIGVLDEAGNLSIVDRKKEMFIVGGFNAYPAEIENLLSRHPAVAVAAVVGVPDPRQGETGCAFVVAADESGLTPESLITWARQTMSNYKVPGRVHLVDALPLTANGKVDKAALRARAAELG